MSFVEQHVDSPVWENRFKAVKDYVLLSLGWPLVRIELTDQHIMLAIIEAVTYFYKFAAMNEGMRVVNVDQWSQVTIPPDINKHMIQDVIFPYSVIDAYMRGFGSLDFSDETGLFVIANPALFQLLGGFNMALYYEYLKYLEDFKNLIGIQRHWEIMGERIQLYPKDAKYTQVGLLFKHMMTDDELEQENWIKSWSLAKSKHILGTIRGKFTGFTAGGTNVAADGEALKAEAKEEMAALREELKLYQRPLPLMQISGG